MSNIAGSLNNLIWLLFLIAVIALVVWAVRSALAPRGGRTYRDETVVRQPVPHQPASGGLSPGWYPDQNDHSAMRYWDGRVWTSETQPGR